MRYMREYISARTGFDSGEEFTSEEQVREYFTEGNMRMMFRGSDPEELPAQDDLDEMAFQVIENRWHCRF